VYSDVRKCVESASDQLSVTGSRDSHDTTEHLNTAEPLYDGQFGELKNSLLYGGFHYSVVNLCA
jgi:hypothetical protein